MSRQLELFEENSEDVTPQLESLMVFPNRVDESLLRDAYQLVTGLDLFSFARATLAEFYCCHSSEILPKLRNEKYKEIIRHRLTSYEKKPAGRERGRRNASEKYSHPLRQSIH